VKRSQPRKTRAPAAYEAGAEVTPNSMRAGRKRCMYPPEANTPEAHTEFLESLSDLINVRIAEIKRAHKKDVGDT